MTAARRRIVDRLRRETVAARALPLLAVDAELTEDAARTMADWGDPHGLADERLRLVLLCAHPSLPPEAAAALTLRMVLGVSTEDLARLFLVRTSTMAARLTRARKSLAHERFAVPTGAELGDRVAVVADVAYLAFTAGYAAGSGPGPPARRRVRRGDPAGPGPARRAARRARRRASWTPLLALMLLQHSRRDARQVDGRLVLLPDQDRGRWHQEEITEALAHPRAAGPRPAGAVPAPGADRRGARHRAAAAGHRVGPHRLALRRAARAGRLARRAAQPGGGGGRVGRTAGRAGRAGRVPGSRPPATTASGPSCCPAPAWSTRHTRRTTRRSTACGNEAERAHLAGRKALLSGSAAP